MADIQLLLALVELHQRDFLHAVAQLLDRHVGLVHTLVLKTLARLGPSLCGELLTNHIELLSFSLVSFKLRSDVLILASLDNLRLEAFLEFLGTHERLWNGILLTFLTSIVITFDRALLVRLSLVSWRLVSVLVVVAALLLVAERVGNLFHLKAGRGHILTLIVTLLSTPVVHVKPGLALVLSRVS